MLEITEEDRQFANNLIDAIQATGPSAYRLYAIIDGAQAPEIYRNLQRYGDVFMSMYMEDVAEILKAAGPLLYQFRKDDELTAWLIKHGAFNHWFILFPSLGKTMVDLRRHFKRFAYVLSPKGERWYFRYYDPRVFAAFMPTADQEQKDTIFGNFACIWGNAPGTRDYRKYVNQHTLIAQTIELPFAEPAVSPAIESAVSSAAC